MKTVKRMKKSTTILLVLAMVLSLPTAFGQNDGDSTDKGVTTKTFTNSDGEVIKMIETETNDNGETIRITTKEVIFLESGGSRTEENTVYPKAQAQTQEGEGDKKEECPLTVKEMGEMSLWEQCHQLHASKPLYANIEFQLQHPKCQDTFKETIKKCKLMSDLIRLNNPDGIEDGMVDYDPQMGEIKCISNNGNAIDFKSCKTFLNLYRGQRITDQALIMEQEIEKTTHANKQGEEMAEIAKDINNSQGKYIDVAKDHAKKGKNLANVRGSYQAVKFTTFGGVLAGYMTPNKAEDDCKALPNGDEELCQEILGGDKSVGAQLFLNAAIKSRVTQMVAQSGIKGAAEFIVANQYKKQMDRLDGIKDDLNNSEDDGTIIIEEDTMVSECNYNPTLPQCQGLSLNHTASGHGGINFGSGAAAEYTGGSDGNELDFSNNNDFSNTKPSEMSPGLASDLAAFDTKSGNHFVDGNGGPGTVSYGSLGSGGGGGGSASAGGAPGSGSGGAGSSSDDKVNPLTMKKAGVSYAGGKRGKRGRYVASAGKKKSGGTSSSSNPFAKFFNKNKNKSGNSLLNFRDPASQLGSKKDSLFSRISRRYDDMEKKKRLLEYIIEQQKK